MDYSGQQINNRLVQICVLTECQKYAGTKLQDACQYEEKNSWNKTPKCCQYEDQKINKE
jgi:hypothetical protein